MRRAQDRLHRQAAVGIAARSRRSSNAGREEKRRGRSTDPGNRVNEDETHSARGQRPREHPPRPHRATP